MAKIVKRENFKIDATDKPLGRLACEIAILLRGKNRSDFLPYQDNGNFVEVTNASKVKLSGRKIEQKKYYHHSLYPGGMRETFAKDLITSNPQKMIMNAVIHMIPKTKLRNNIVKRLTITK